VLPLSVVHPTWERTRPHIADDLHCGWTFRSPSDPAVTPPSGTGSISCDDCIPDTNHGCKFVRDLYDLSQDTEGKYTVPILWDKKTSTIVNNESSEILRMLNGPFAKLVGTDTTTQDLYPEALRPRIDEVNDWVYHNINNGVYKCGFARGQVSRPVRLPPCVLVHLFSILSHTLLPLLHCCDPHTHRRPMTRQ
jgi:putative glutathione S-transferase